MHYETKLRACTFFRRSFQRNDDAPRSANTRVRTRSGTDTEKNRRSRARFKLRKCSVIPLLLLTVTNFPLRRVDSARKSGARVLSSAPDEKTYFHVFLLRVKRRVRASLTGLKKCNIADNFADELRKRRVPRSDGSPEANRCKNHVVTIELEILCNALIISEGSNSLLRN